MVYSADQDQFNNRNGKVFLFCPSFLFSVFLHCGGGVRRHWDFATAFLAVGNGSLEMGRVGERWRTREQGAWGRGGWSFRRLQGATEQISSTLRRTASYTRYSTMET
jgi:hypothetical protein